MANDMFPKYDGGPVGVVDVPEKNVVMDEDTLSQRATDMAPENDRPWNPIEGVDEKDIDNLLHQLDEPGDMQKYVEMYQDGIREMQNILTDFRNSAADASKKSFSELERIKKYIDQFNSELVKKDSRYQAEFLARVDFFLKKEGIDRKELVEEVSQEYVAGLQEGKEVRIQENKTRKAAVKPVEQVGFFRGLFR